MFTHKSIDTEYHEKNNNRLISLDKKLELASYGGLLVENLDSHYHIKGVYNQVNTRLVETFTNNGTVTNSDGLFSLSSGTGFFDYAVLRSKKQINFHAGIGGISRFACTFDTPVANYWQLAGLGVSGNGLFFGYNGTTFSILRQSGGVGEVRSLQITTAENGTETATVTLNSVEFTVNLTNAGGDINYTVYQLCEDTYTGWDVSCIGDTLYFSATSTGAKSGTYSYSSTGASVGTFSSVTPGVSDTYNWISNEDWNEDPMDGSGKSGETIDTTKGNIYQIKYQWGFGEIGFYIESNTTGKFVLVHRIKYVNNNTTVSLRRPSLKSLFAVYSAGGTGTNMNMKVAGFGGSSEGISKKESDLWGYSFQKSISSNTETNILVLRNKALQNGIVNNSELFLNNITVASDGTKNVIIRVYLNGTISAGTTSDYYKYIAIDTNSHTLVDTTSDTISNGTLINSFVLGKSTAIESAGLRGIRLDRLETLTITGESAQSSTISVGVNWTEDI